MPTTRCFASTGLDLRVREHGGPGPERPTAVLVHGDPGGHWVTRTHPAQVAALALEHVRAHAGAAPSGFRSRGA